MNENDQFLPTWTQFIGRANSNRREQIGETDDTPRKTHHQTFLGTAKWFWRSLISRKTLKCFVVYMTAALVFVFTPSIRGVFGSSCYLACTNIIIFHPAKNIGTMVEAGLAAVIALTFGAVSAATCLMLVFAIGPENKETAHALCLALLFCSAFVLAYIKATLGKRRPAIGSATNTANLLMFVTITRIANESIIAILPQKLAQTIFSVFSGVAFSIAGAFLLWPQSSSSLLLKTLAESLAPLTGMFQNLAATSENRIELVAGPDVRLLREDRNVTDLSRMLAMQDRSIIALADLEHEIKHEVLSGVYLHGKCYQQLISKVKKLKTHIGGLATNVNQIESLLSTSGSCAEALESLISLYSDVLSCCESFLKTGSSALPLRSLALELQSQLADTIAFYEGYLETERKKWAPEAVLVRKNIELFVIFVQLSEFGSDLLYLTRQVVRLEKLLNRKLSILGTVKDCVDCIRKGRYWKSRRYPQSWSSPLLALYNQSSGHPHFTRNANSESTFAAFSQRVFGSFEHLETRHLKHAFKTAGTIVLLAFPAFIDEFQAVFLSWRLHWTLTTAVVVMTPSVGASNITGLYRLIGTVAGASLGYVAFIFADKSQITAVCVLAVVALCLWTPFLHSQYPKIAQIALLTFSVVFLGKFATLSDSTFGDAPIGLFAFQRWFAVTLGVVVGLFVTHFIWPFRARVEVRKGLSAVVFDLALLYSRLMAQFGAPKDWSEHPVDFNMLESDMRRMLADQRSLISDTANEPGIFSETYKQDSYTNIIDSCELVLSLLSCFYSVINSRMPAEQTSSFDPHGLPVSWSSENLVDQSNLIDGLLFRFPVTSLNKNFAAILEKVEPARRNMLASVILSLYVASSCLRMEKPEPPFLPNPRSAQRQLLQMLPGSISDISQYSVRDLLHVFYLANILLLPKVLNEIDLIHVELRNLFEAIPYTVISSL